VVPKDRTITIAVRFKAGDDFFCQTYYGHGGDRVRRQLEQTEGIRVEDTGDCTKGETDYTFG